VEQVPVFTALSRGSRESLIEVLPGPVSAAMIQSILAPVVRTDAVLCSDSASAYKTAAHSLRILVRQIPRGSPKLGPYHIQNANAGAGTPTCPSSIAATCSVPAARTRAKVSASGCSK
jgi:hypothetical protein